MPSCKIFVGVIIVIVVIIIVTGGKQSQSSLPLDPSSMWIGFGLDLDRLWLEFDKSEDKTSFMLNVLFYLLSWISV